MKKALAGGVFVIAAAVIAFVFFGRTSTTPKLTIKTLDPWILQTNDPSAIHGMTNNARAAYLGNGYIGVRIGADGTGLPSSCWMSGLYEDEALVPLPNWAAFPLFDSEGKQFKLDETAPYRQTLNMREGYVETELTLKSGRERLTGKVIFMMKHRREDRIPDAVIRYELVPNRSGVVKVKHGVPKDSTWQQLATSKDAGGYDISSAKSKAGDVSIESIILTGDEKTVEKQHNVERGKRFDLTKYVVVRAVRKESPELRYNPDPADGSIEKAVGLGFDDTSQMIRDSWRELWKSDIIIEGDPETQQIVHAMMFYLLSSVSWDWSIPPTGLSSGAWRGHIFWDADIWMLPSLVLQHPNLAEGIVNYRLNVLNGAMENAKRRGLEGAEFAWESARTGLETVGQPYSEERHVTADAALAAWTWLQSRPTNDNYDLVYPLVEKTAQYWASRVTYNSEKDRYEIHNVLPPDEEANKNSVINNSVYTNIAAAMNLKIAIESARMIGTSYPAKWEEIAGKMYIPFDESNKRFIEYDGYNGETTKQADVELLIYPLMHPMPDDVKASTFDYYKTKTDPKGPAMTSSIHSIIAAELDRPKEAYEHFLASYRDFLRGPFLLFNEKRSETYENMCFVTGCGGSLQSVIYGFAGLRIGKNPGGFKELLPGLYIKPCLPEKWKKIQITGIKWSGKTYDLTVMPGNQWKLDEYN